MNHHSDIEGTENYIDTVKKQVDQIEAELVLKPHNEVAQEKWVISKIRDKIADVYIKVMSGKHITEELATIQELFTKIS